MKFFYLASAAVIATAFAAGVTAPAHAEAKKYTFRPSAEKHQQPVLRPGPRRLQESRGGERRQIRVPVYRPRRAWRRRGTGAGGRRPGRQESRRHRGLGGERRGHGASAGRREEGRHSVLTWDSDLLPKDKELRIAYVGTHNYDIGVNLAKIAQEIKPNGGTICIQSGGAAAANHNERMQGIRDTLSEVKSAESPGDRLTGQNGWTEADGCPLYTNDDFPVSVQQLEDILNKYPNLDAFIPTGGFPQFTGRAFERVAEEHKAQIDERIARPGGRRHAADPDRPAQERSVRPAGRPAAVRHGLRRDELLPTTSRKVSRRQKTRPIPGSTSARRRTPTPAWAAAAESCEPYGCILVAWPSPGA